MLAARANVLRRKLVRSEVDGEAKVMALRVPHYFNSVFGGK